MSSFALKLIAMITMLIDHAGYILFENSPYYMYFRMIGRLAFPIYCFLLVEGFYHTSNVKKYLKRLGVFAIISEIPFDLAFHNTTNTSFLDGQNVFFTLYIGLLVIYFMSLVIKKYPRDIMKQNVVNFTIIAIGCIVSKLLGTDYDILGVLIIVSFYLFRSYKLLLTMVMLLLNYGIYGSLQALATISMVFIWFYNGKKGLKINKYIFYAFYPVHILLLVLISRLT